MKATTLPDVLRAVSGSGGEGNPAGRGNAPKGAGMYGPYARIGLKRRRREGGAYVCASHAAADVRRSARL